MTSFFYDFEFLENGRTIDPISIGIVRVNFDDSTDDYYGVNCNAPWARIRKHKWLMANVVPSLPLLPRSMWSPSLNVPIVDIDDPVVKSKATIAEEVRRFLLSGDTPPELWTWYGAYDHVVLMQFWGTMIDHPEGIPMFSMDLRQECQRLGLTSDDLPKQADDEEHNALADAYHNLNIARTIMKHTYPIRWPLR